MSTLNNDQQAPAEDLARKSLPAARSGEGSLVREPIPGQLNEAPNALSLLKALRRRWALALSLGIIGSSVVGIATWLCVPTPKYSARALFRVSSDAPKVIFATSESKIDLDTYQKTQVTMIKSRGVLEKAVESLEGNRPSSLSRSKGDPVEWLAKELKVDYTGEVLRITLIGDNPEGLMTLVNAVVDAYIVEVVDKEKQRRQERHTQLKAIYDKYQTRLEERRKSLRSMAELIGSNDKSVVAIKHQLVLERLSLAERELMEIQSEVRRAEAQLAMRPSPAPVEAGPTPVPAVSERIVEEHLAQDQITTRLRQRMAQIESDLNAARRVARDQGDPSIQRHFRLLTEAKGALADRREMVVSDLRKSRTSGTTRVGSGTAQDQEAQKANIEMLKQLEMMTAGLVKKLTEESRQFNHEALGYESLQDEIAHADTAAKKIGNELETLNVELEATSRVVPIERAAMPRQEDERGPIKMAAMSTLGTFALILSLVSWYEFRSLRVGSVDDVTRGLGMRVVGTLPVSTSRPRLPLIGPATDRFWNRIMIESVDAARAMVLHAARTESYRVVMVTSALSGEGKTSLACHLATSLARAGRRTLIVDCDLRRPAAHRLFDVEVEPGFCDYLRGEALLPDLVRPTGVEGLSIIAAGRGDALAIQALNHDRSWAAFDWMRHGYDFVVVDSAPILPVADSLTLGQCVDAVIFSIMRDVSRLPKVYAAHAQLTELGVRTIGAIVSGAHKETYVGHYGPLEA